MAGGPFYFLNAAATGAAHGKLQDGGTAPGVSTSTTGWDESQANGNDYSKLIYATASAVAWSPSALPASPLTTTDCWRTDATLNGSFAAGNWTIAISAIAQNQTVGGPVNLRVRVYRGANATGTGATEITSAALDLTAFTNLLTTVAQNGTVTWNAPAITCTNEYLFFQIALKCTTKEVSQNNQGPLIRIDGTNSKITPTAFTPASSAVFDDDVAPYAGVPSAAVSYRAFGDEDDSPALPLVVADADDDAWPKASLPAAPPPVLVPNDDSDLPIAPPPTFVDDDTAPAAVFPSLVPIAQPPPLGDELPLSAAVAIDDEGAFVPAPSPMAPRALSFADEDSLPIAAVPTIEDADAPPGTVAGYMRAVRPAETEDLPIAAVAGVVDDDGAAPGLTAPGAIATRSVDVEEPPPPALIVDDEPATSPAAAAQARPAPTFAVDDVLVVGFDDDPALAPGAALTPAHARIVAVLEDELASIALFDDGAALPGASTPPALSRWLSVDDEWATPPVVGSIVEDDGATLIAAPRLSATLVGYVLEDDRILLIVRGPLKHPPTRATGTTITRATPHTPTRGT